MCLWCCVFHTLTLPHVGRPDLNFWTLHNLAAFDLLDDFPVSSTQDFPIFYSWWYIDPWLGWSCTILDPATHESSPIVTKAGRLYCIKDELSRITFRRAWCGPSFKITWVDETEGKIGFPMQCSWTWAIPPCLWGSTELNQFIWTTSKCHRLTKHCSILISAMMLVEWLICCSPR